MNIRQNLGEAVPTIIFRQIAHKIRKVLNRKEYTEQEIINIIQKNKLTEHTNLLNFISKKKKLGFALLSKIAELANAQREDNAAFYTRQDICYSVLKNLPEAKDFTTLSILEPSIGVGNFLPVLIDKYKSVSNVVIDVVDIDKQSIEILKALVETLAVPNNISLNYINSDFLLHKFEKHYDIIVGNPPYKKITKEKKLLAMYKATMCNKATNNIFSFFIEKAMRLGDVISLIVPKSLINAPEFNDTRAMMAEKRITHIIDFGEKGFKGVKIETICFILNTKQKPHLTQIESYITNDIRKHEQKYITDATFPYWLIYRNTEFDNVANRLQFNLFKAYRDRSITKAVTHNRGKVRVLKSRNIGNNEIVNISDYDCYIDDISKLDVAKFINQKQCFLVPNLTYNPRACALPPNCIADGSVAILTPINDKVQITKQDLEFYATDEFSSFYAIARNMGTRSLNIDNNSVFFFGKLKY
jgi:DNA (cytosine-5)-methyltransferase 1